jgi:hypothetical protein
MLRSLVIATVVFANGCQTSGREIPLKEIVSTVRQEGSKYIGSGRRIVDGKEVEEDYASAMSELTRSRMGASNALIVDGNTIGDAIKATQLALAGFRPADRPVPSFNVETGNNWLAVYLGCGHSEPRKWVVEGATVDGNTIRLAYRAPAAKVQTADVVFYYYWVPIGALDDGVYDLELFDNDLNAATLMRRVEVKRR